MTPCRMPPSKIMSLKLGPSLVRLLLLENENADPERSEAATWLAELLYSLNEL